MYVRTPILVCGLCVEAVSKKEGKDLLLCIRATFLLYVQYYRSYCACHSLRSVCFSAMYTSASRWDALLSCGLLSALTSSAHHNHWIPVPDRSELLIPSLKLFVSILPHSSPAPWALLRLQVWSLIWGFPRRRGSWEPARFGTGSLALYVILFLNVLIFSHSTRIFDNLRRQRLCSPWSHGGWQVFQCLVILKQMKFKTFEVIHIHRPNTVAEGISKCGSPP